ncbi:MAG: hypothetical protein EOP11_10235 [Proteobacteria bacterium]|nr:MAG: hypothetical protein EOP11_10235 [Pseudomonadota bacterium]
MRLVIKNTLALLLILFVAKVALQAQPEGDTSVARVPKSLMLSSLSEGQTIPSGHFHTDGVVKSLNRAALTR